MNKSFHKVSIPRQNWKLHFTVSNLVLSLFIIIYWKITETRLTQREEVLWTKCNFWQLRDILKRKKNTDLQTTTSMLDCVYDGVFIKFCFVDLWGQTLFKKFHFCLISFVSSEYFPKVLGIIKIVFWQLWNKSFCCYLQQLDVAFRLSYGECLPMSTTIHLGRGLWKINVWCCWPPKTLAM